jgi:chorismate synthase
MSINGVEGVEMGIGFEGTLREGSAYHDEIVLDEASGNITRATNHAGGIEGGMSNAQPVVVRAAMKPIPTLRIPLRSVDVATGEPGMAHKERTDSCVVPAAAVIGESMVCLVIADAMLEKFGGDSLEQVQAHMAASAAY